MLLRGKIIFRGWLKHTEVQDVLASSHVLGFPSIREFGGGVVLEAMALGVIPMIVDYAGPSELVTSQTGFKIPLGTRGSIVQGFRELLGRASEQRGALAMMAEAGIAQINTHFTWAAKAEKIMKAYQWAISGGPKPQL